MSDLDRQSSGIHAPEDSEEAREEARELRTSNQHLIAELRAIVRGFGALDIPMTSRVADALQEQQDEIERLTRECVETNEHYIAEGLKRRRADDAITDLQIANGMKANEIERLRAALPRVCYASGVGGMCQLERGHSGPHVFR